MEARRIGGDVECSLARAIAEAAIRTIFNAGGRQNGDIECEGKVGETREIQKAMSCHMFLRGAIGVREDGGSGASGIQIS